MPKLEFTDQELKSYFNRQMMHMHYEESNKKCNQFAPHSEGTYPKNIIEIQRPNESDEVKKYRERVWQPITKPTFTRVLNSLGKIRRSQDWSVKYNSLSDFSKITHEENLEQYCEFNLPLFGSVTNWVFDLMLKKYLTDPNSVVLVMPIEPEVSESAYLKPYPYIFDCCDVIDFAPNDYAILNNPEGAYYQVKGKMILGESYYVITTQSIRKYDQLNARRDFYLASEYIHGLPIMPAYKPGGLICDVKGYNFLYESRICGILPNLNEAVAEYTDLQAGKRLHIYPERWEYTQHECPACKGVGIRPNPAYVPGGSYSANIQCSNCKGAGYLPNGPYSKLLVKPTNVGEQAIPNPPAGYIEKDVEIIRIMDEGVDKHIYKALAAINFQFLDQTPLNQSGVAKEVDKDELNNTVHLIAEDIVSIMDRFYKLCAYYRYKTLYSFKEIDKMLPSVAVPEHFDLLSTQYIQEETTKAKTGKMNPVIVNAMEIEFTGKRFISDPEIMNMLQLVLKLDPLPNIPAEEKMTMLSNNGITLEDYVISCNIQHFIQWALNEDDDFQNKPLEQQEEKLKAYAKEVIDENSAAQKVSVSMGDATSDNEEEMASDTANEDVNDMPQ